MSNANQHTNPPKPRSKEPRLSTPLSFTPKNGATTPCPPKEDDGKRRIGIMGGTFDPIHMGHLVTAEQARVDCELDEVIFVPAGQPWQKGEGVTPAEIRYLMVVLATASNPYFSVSRVEINRGGPSYTVDTLRHLKASYEDADFLFITGADAILNILTWKDASDALQLAEFVAATRPGYSLATLREHDLEDKVIILDVPALAISSTDVRNRLSQSRAASYLIPVEVEQFARKHGLYGTTGTGLNMPLATD